MFNFQGVKSTIVVSFKPVASLEAETKYHIEMMPSTCLVNKKLLTFVSGYRNYAAKQLLVTTLSESLKQPAGDLVMSSF
jgi:hypothetical protein